MASIRISLHSGMGKPRATRNRTVVLSSDEDEGASSSSRPESPRPTRSRIGRKPEKPQVTKRSPKKKQQAATETKVREKSLYSFFSRSTQQAQQSQPAPAAKEPDVCEVEDFDDIEDDQDIEEQLAIKSGADSTAGALAIRKRPHDGPLQAARKQKYLKSDDGRGTMNREQDPSHASLESKPWTERFAPQNFDELAVHKKKVADVRSWLFNTFNGTHRKRLLVLKGPAGSGKTATIDLLSKDLQFGLQDWRNPTSSIPGVDGFLSTSAQFEDFLARSGTFGSLSMQTAGSETGHAIAKAQPAGRQAILVEEFPNTASSATQQFRKSILRYLAASTPSGGPFSHPPSDDSVTPVIMIISETLLSANTTSADSFTAHRLLGQEILTHLGVSVIEFNPIAPTILAKALELVAVKEARVSGRRKTPGPQVIKQLSEIGDVRSAISSFQFLCLRGDDQDGWGTRIAFSKPKKGARNPPLTAMEKDSLESITQRESSLGIFHAVGNVVYNKRVDNAAPVVEPPPYLVGKSRPKPSEVDVDSLIDELGTDVSTFVSALHENYVLSCSGLTDEDSLDSLDGCIASLSDADLISPDRFSSNGYAKRTMQGTGSDALRQEELSFHSAVRGLLFHLPNPVKRSAPSNAGRADAFRMFYPTSLRLWRRREEIEGLLDIWVHKAQSGSLRILPREKSQKLTKKAAPAEWAFGRHRNMQDNERTNEEGRGLALIAGGSSARREMLLERLPFMAAMQRTNPNPEARRLLREMQDITSFTGVGASTDEAPDDEGPPSGGSPVKKKSFAKMDRKGTMDSISGASQEDGITEDGVAALVLSDDDIEDD